MNLRSLINLGAPPTVILKHPGPDGSDIHGTGTDQSVHGGGAGGISLAEIDRKKEGLASHSIEQAKEVRQWAFDNIQRLHDDRHLSREGSTIQRLNNLYYAADNVIEGDTEPFDIELPLSDSLTAHKPWWEISPYGPMVANRLRFQVTKHFGPGPHPGTGTPQSVHGGEPSETDVAQYKVVRNVRMKGIHATKRFPMDTFQTVLDEGLDPEKSKGFLGVGTYASFGPSGEALQADVLKDRPKFDVDIEFEKAVFIETKGRSMNEQAISDIFAEIVKAEGGTPPRVVNPGGRLWPNDWYHAFREVGIDGIIYSKDVNPDPGWEWGSQVAALTRKSMTIESVRQGPEPLVPIVEKWREQAMAKADFEVTQPALVFTWGEFAMMVWGTDTIPIAKHAAPIHPGTGTDQSVHGGGGMAFEDEGFFAPFEELYISPIDHSHPVGEIDADLNRILTQGAPIRERFKEARSDRQQDRLFNELFDETREASRRHTDIEMQLWPAETRLRKSLEKVAKFESSRYRGAHRHEQILAHLMNSSNGETFRDRLNSWRRFMATGESEPVEIELTAAQYYELGEWEGRSVEVDTSRIEGWHKVTELRTRNGKIKGGVVRITDEKGLDALKEYAAYRRGDYYEPQGRRKMFEILHEKFSSATPPISEAVQPTDGFWEVSVVPTSAYVWDTDIASHLNGVGGTMAEIPYLAAEIDTEKFVGPAFRIGVSHEIPDTARPSNGGWEWNFEDNHPDLVARTRLLPSEVLVDRFLADAETVRPRLDQLSADLDVAAAELQKMRVKRRAFHRDFVVDFLNKEGIRTGTEVNVASKRGSGKILSADTKALPAGWIEAYNQYTEDRPLTVHKKRGGGTYFSSGRPRTPGRAPHMETDGSVSTNLHEMGHGIEDIPGMRPLVAKFFDYRTNDSSIRSRVGKEAGGHGRVYSDSFTDAYSGKKYSWGHYEILSNGLGGLYGGHRGLPDDEHLDFLFGLMVETAT